MKIFLMRHGTAEDGVDDSARRLVEKGREQARLVADQLERMGERPDRILSSPLTRARETAEAVVSQLGGRLPAITVESRLAPGTPIDEMAAAICAVEARVLLAVGHEPSLSRLAAQLAGASGLRLELKKGGLVELELLEGEPRAGGSALGAPRARAGASLEQRAILLGLLRPGHLRGSSGT